MNPEPHPPHRWKKGQSGNPGGRAKTRIPVVDKETGETVEMTVTQIARTHTIEAIEALLKSVRGDNGSERNTAAIALLDRGWGKPAQSLELSGPDGGPIETEASGINLAALTTDELRQLEVIRGKLAADPDAE